MLTPTRMSAKVYHAYNYTHTKTAICTHMHTYIQARIKEKQNLLGVNLCPHESYIEVLAPISYVAKAETGVMV